MTKLVAVSLAVWLVKVDCTMDDKGSDAAIHELESGVQVERFEAVMEKRPEDRTETDCSELKEKAYKRFAEVSDDLSVPKAIEIVLDCHRNTRHEYPMFLGREMIGMDEISEHQCGDEEFIKVLFHGLLMNFRYPSDSILEKSYPKLYEYLYSSLEHYLELCGLEKIYKQGADKSALVNYPTLADYLIKGLCHKIYNVPLTGYYFATATLEETISFLRNYENNMISTIDCEAERTKLESDTLLADFAQVIEVDKQRYKALRKFVFEPFARYLEVCGFEKTFEPVAAQIVKYNPEEWKSKEAPTLAEYLESYLIEHPYGLHDQETYLVKLVFSLDKLALINEIGQDMCNDKTVPAAFADLHHIIDETYPSLPEYVEDRFKRYAESCRSLVGEDQIQPEQA